MKKILLLVCCGCSFLCFGDKYLWEGLRAMQESSSANRQAFNDTMDSFFAERFRMAQMGGGMGINPQAQVTQAISALPSEQRVLIIELIWAKIKQEICARNFAEMQRVVNLAEPALQRYDPQYQQRSREVAALLLSAMQGNMNSGMLGTGFGSFAGEVSPSVSGSGTRRCLSCHGTGTCPICKGTGRYSNYGQTVPCDRKCSSCRGSGTY